MVSNPATRWGMACLASVAWSVWPQAVTAQSTSGDPHLSPIVQSRTFERVSDVLVPTGADIPPHLRTAFPMDPVPTTRFDRLPSQRETYWPLPNNRWDFGVMPVKLPEDVTDTERSQFWAACRDWAASEVICVPRTTQSVYLEVTREGSSGSCSSGVGSLQGIAVQQMRLPGTCWSGALHHELGHALGLFHEHQRPDRDDYMQVDLEKVGPPGSRSQFEKQTLDRPRALGPYDFLSVMHYTCSPAGAMVPLPPFAEFTGRCGGNNRPTELDLQGLRSVYHGQLIAGFDRVPSEPLLRTFSRQDFLFAMERLHAFYMSPQGLKRPEGLSINGRPDFLGVATWIFDVYLGARSAGWHHWAAFDIVAATITQTDEWRTKNPQLTPIQPSPFTPGVRLDRAEFLEVLFRLDRFYAAPEGLQRPDGLSISNGPDFLGIATWVFDVYLNERLRGTNPETAWQIVVRAIQNTDEWRRKH